MADKSPPFAVRSSDAHAVSSALAAADRSWRRGESAAVLRWLQRAAEAAREAKDEIRAVELAKCAREIAAQLQAAAKRPPPDPGSSPGAPSSVHLLTKVAGPRAASTAVTAHHSRPDLAGEVARSRLPGGFEEDTNQVAIFQLRGGAAKKEPPDRALTPRKGVPRGPTPPEAATRAHARDEWSIETITGDDISVVPSDDLEEDEPAPLTPVRVPVRPTQAVKVCLWRDEEGGLYVTTAGAPAPAHAIEAMLTALEPDVDLVALLEEPPR